MIYNPDAKIMDHEYNRRSDEIDDDDNDDAHTTPTAPYSVLPSDEDREAIINDALDELADVARENILEFKREDFNDSEVVGTWIDSYLCQYFAEINGHMSNYSSATAAEADALNDVTDAYICELYDDIYERFYEEIAPPRVSPATHTILQAADIVDCFTDQIQTLREKPQPEQRTPEWYSRRNNLITASAASKAFGTQASVNQLIYEKCKKYSASEDGGGGGGGSTGPMQGSVNSPLHWGQRYEPLTVMVYEHRNHTKLGEFGCIQHDTYPFIGASPDGINIDPTSPIYGRMVEIKNIFNREITGQPKEEYWIQTQIQMEVCGLDECDFVETRFKEYDGEEEYLADATATDDANEKGVILWFQSAPALSHYGCVSSPIQLYEYAPIGATAAEYEKWEVDMFAKHERLRSIWVRTIYWYLDEYSCVLIKRNRLWFEEAVLVLQDVWATIEEERQTGYEHRAPKRKTAASGGMAAHSGSSGGGEFFKIVKLDNAIIPPTPMMTNTLPADNIAPTATTTTPDTTTTAEFTATNMATLMLINDINTYKKRSVKRPSDVLINCFKIDDLEIDESKVKQ